MLKKNKFKAQDEGKTHKKKHCPFIDRECIGEDCEWYYADFDKCLIGVLNYNLFALKKAIENS
ncbi:MAG: hypothetical protein R6U40_04455 [Desulfobacterales bacterium]